MTLVVHPRLPAASDRIQVFVGDLQATAARAPAFEIDGAPAHPIALRPLSAVRDAATGVRAFTGVYEFRGLEPDLRYTATVRVGTESRAVVVRTLPERVRSENDGGFDVMLVSCFYRAECNSGALAHATRELCSSVRAKRAGGRSPDCALFMGDQVYLDLPTLETFPSDPARLAQKFEENYRLNWEGVFASLLGLAPSACLPDDHEYWNNAPHASPMIQNSWTARGRASWRGEARRAYEAFAQPFTGRSTDPALDPLVVDVHPISFFLADGRSARDEQRRFTLTAACRSRLREWIDDLNESGRIGVFVTGQSLFREPTSRLEGRVADWEMPNYGDFGLILAELHRAKGRLLALTGDVHWGRVVSARSRNTGAERVQEVVVSPSSLVSFVGHDQAVGAWNWIKGLAGRSDPWPRHGNPEPPPAELKALGVALPDRYACSVAAAAGAPALVKGDQIALLSFDWTNGRLRAAVTYFPIHDTLTRPLRVPLFDVAIAS